MKIEMNDTVKAAIWNATASDEEMEKAHNADPDYAEMFGCVSIEQTRRAARHTVIAWAAGFPTDS